ncbi:MAG: DUF6516 family protein [Chloroflexota bacterium]|mgnify:FL=1
MTTLHQYFARLEDTILSRTEIEVQQILIRKGEPEEDQGQFLARLSFYDASLLEAAETVRLEDGDIIKDRYSYHYQESNGDIVFRYDNAPHHPEIETFPHHKHVESEENIIASQPPDMSEVLVEIDGVIYTV